MPSVTCQACWMDREASDYGAVRGLCIECWSVPANRERFPPSAEALAFGRAAAPNATAKPAEPPKPTQPKTPRATKPRSRVVVGLVAAMRARQGLAARIREDEPPAESPTLPPLAPWALTPADLAAISRKDGR